jgi:mycothiol system anti-sigma-R factor
MDCRQAKEVMFLFFDGEMEAAVLAPFRHHLDGCGDCAHQLDYTRKLLLLVRERCVRRAAPARLRQRILVSFPHRQAPGLQGGEAR